MPLVLDAAHDDAVAAEILRHAGQELARTAGAVLQKLALRSVAVTGGVLTHAVMVRRAFEMALAEQIPGVSIQEPRYDPTIGAALLVSL